MNYESIWWEQVTEIHPSTFFYSVEWVTMFDAQPNDEIEEIYENMEFQDALPYEDFVDVGEWSDEEEDNVRLNIGEWSDED